MDRRTAIRTLATATVLPMLAPRDASALLDARRVLDAASDGLAPNGLSSATPHDFVPAALTPAELEIVGIVADVILPRTDTPGATDVGVPAFVDLIASEWMDDDEAQDLHDGLARLDGTALERFGAAFASCTAEQQTTLVRELDDALPEPGVRGDRPDGFYPMLKRLVLTGYFTTEVGAAQSGFRIIPGNFAGCVVPEAGR